MNKPSEQNLFCASFSAYDAQDSELSNLKCATIAFTPKQFRELIQQFEKHEQEHGENMNVFEVIAILGDETSQHDRDFNRHEIGLQTGVSLGSIHSPRLRRTETE